MTGYISINFDDGFKTQIDYTYPLLQAHGMKATFFVNTGRILDGSSAGYPTMSIADLQTLTNNGHEVGSHGHDHVEFPSLPYADQVWQHQTSQNYLRSWGCAGDNFSYPDGVNTPETDTIALQFYRSARNGYIEPFVVPLPFTPPYAPLHAQQGDFGDGGDWARITALVDQAFNADMWVDITFHNIVPGGGSYQNSMDTSTFDQFLTYIQAKGLATLTMNQALDFSPNNQIIFDGRVWTVINGNWSVS